MKCRTSIEENERLWGLPKPIKIKAFQVHTLTHVNQQLIVIEVAKKVIKLYRPCCDILTSVLQFGYVVVKFVPCLITKGPEKEQSSNKLFFW